MDAVAPAVPREVIVADGLGIRFSRNRRRNLRLRELLFQSRGGARGGGQGSLVPSGEFWALRQVSFKVFEGESVGLVGANGQGKSTLLKLIAGVLLPDEGSVEVHQGVAPLIEVTGGFVGDLTARDNIYLTAGLHGMSRQEVEARFDEIVEFAEVGDFLDTPFRHFSSGMKARLGFAVVTSLDEPIVLVDEVLAVGDKAFRRKCNKRIEHMLASGRTLFLVSHSERNLRRLCTRGLCLRQGRLMVDGSLQEALAAYNEDNADPGDGGPGDDPGDDE